MTESGMMSRVSRERGRQGLLLSLFLGSGVLSLIFAFSAYSCFVPDFGLIFLYFCALYMPVQLPAGVVFGMGLLRDGLVGTPLGVFGFFYLIIDLFSHHQRRYLFKKPFFSGWAVFVILVFASVALKSMALVWIMTCPWRVDALIYEGMLTALSYPFMVKACFVFYHKFSNLLIHFGLFKGHT